MNVLARGLETSRAFKAPSGVSLRSVSIFYRYRRSRPLKYTDKGYYIQIQAQCKAYSSHADMDITRQRLVERIHRTDTKLVLYVTGGGTHVRQDLDYWWKISKCQKDMDTLLFM